MDRVMSVKNKQCEVMSRITQNMLQADNTYIMEKLSKEEHKLRYHLKLMQVSQPYNMNHLVPIISISYGLRNSVHSFA